MGRWQTIARAKSEKKNPASAISGTPKTPETPQCDVSGVLGVPGIGVSEKKSAAPAIAPVGFGGFGGSAKGGFQEIFSEAETLESDLTRAKVATPVPPRPAGEDITKLQRAADRRNREAVAAGFTNRFCLCGDYASNEWTIDGKRVWLCLECEKERFQQ